MIKNPNWQEATSWYLQSEVELNPGQLETNPDQRLEQDLNPQQPHGNATPTVEAPGYSRHPPPILVWTFKGALNLISFWTGPTCKDAYYLSTVHNLYYHMTRTAPRVLSLQNYWENPCMRPVRDGASRAGKSRPALLGSRTALREMQTNFVAIQIPTFRPKWAMQGNIPIASFIS